MTEFFESIFPFGAISLLTFAVLLFCSISKFLFMEIKDYLERRKLPKLSKEDMVSIYKEAADFIHSKHRTWDLDDGYAEYLWVTNELFKDRNYLKNN